jgi:hypothetical protein
MTKFLAYLISSKLKPRMRIMGYFTIGLLKLCLIVVIFLVASNQTRGEKFGWIEFFIITIIQDLILNPVIELILHILVYNRLVEYLGYKVKQGLLSRILLIIVKHICDEKACHILNHGKKRKILKKVRRIALK